MSCSQWTTDEVRSLCLEQGFARAAVAPADPTVRRKELEAWIRDGHHGTMGWMAEHLPVRADPGARGWRYYYIFRCDFASVRTGRACRTKPGCALTAEKPFGDPT